MCYLFQKTCANSPSSNRALDVPIAIDTQEEGLQLHTRQPISFDPIHRIQEISSNPTINSDASTSAKLLTSEPSLLAPEIEKNQIDFSKQTMKLAFELHGNYKMPRN
jgi:hypothetical protein